MTDWMDDAACRTTGGWHWLPTDTQRDICADCPVLAQCEQWSRREVAQSNHSTREEWRHEHSARRAEAWAGRTLHEWVQELGKPGRKSRGRGDAGRTYTAVTRWCPHGHDTHQTGRYTRGSNCCACLTARNRKGAA